jgi:eukaryotic-like serine/threonine-protein kinase
MHYRNVNPCVTCAERVIVRQLPGYRPVAVLGSGSTGVVTSAHDSVTGGLVAIKWLAKSIQSMPGFSERYRGDASVLSDLESPYITQIYEYVDSAREAAVVMEFVDGVTLRRLLDKGGTLDPKSALYLLKGVLLGLGAAHNRGVTHRDLKPENVIINAVGLPKLTDFGITSVSAHDFLPADHRYRAPEVTGGIDPSRVSDLYSAGIILLECLTGKRPALDGRRPDAQTLVAAATDVPERIRKVVLRSLAAQPTNRFARAETMLDDLEMAALVAYGPDWEDEGKAGVLHRITPLLINRGSGPNAVTRSVAATARWATGVGRFRLAVGGGLVFLLGAAAVTLPSHVFPSSDPGTVPAAATHTPMAVVGPAVPGPNAAGGDKTPPAQPTGVRVIGRSETAVTIDWNASNDNVRVAGYIIQRDGTRVGTAFLPGFTVEGLSPQTTYPLTVVAFDGDGNLSSASAVLLATTLNRPDTIAPSVPTGLRMTSRSQSMIRLAWSPSHDNVGVAGYDVFRDGVRVGEAAQPYFTDSKLAPNSTHTYFVTAFDTTNNASRNSARITTRTLAAPNHTPTTSTPTLVPTTKPPTTAPPASPPPHADPVVSLSIQLGSPSSCRIGIDVVISVTNGPVTGTLSYSVGGQTGEVSGITVNDGDPQTIPLGVTADVSISGTVTVSFGGASASTPWVAVPACLATPSDAPTDAGGGATASG